MINCPINIGRFKNLLPKFFAEKKFSQHIVLIDENTGKHCLPILSPLLPEVKTIQIPSGEAHKNLETCRYIWDRLMDYEADRNSVLINLGGGVICDMGGFAACTYKRGIPYVQIPTTVLAQVDAAIGCKLGVDYHGVKNMIGLIKCPNAIFINADFFKTLPLRQITNGMAEMVKHTLIANAGMYQELARFLPIHLRSKLHWYKIIEHSIEIKMKFVNADPQEQGERKKLNFGHTFGHGIESYSLLHHKNHLLHGEAIAMGMMAELYLSGKKLNLPKKEISKIKPKLATLLPEHYNKLTPDAFPEILNYMKHDKKNSNGMIKCVLLNKIGNAVIDVTITNDEIEEALQTLC